MMRPASTPASGCTPRPRLYTSAFQSRAAVHRELEVYSMDDERVYGPVFHRMWFSELRIGLTCLIRKCVPLYK